MVLYASKVPEQNQDIMEEFAELKLRSYKFIKESHVEEGNNIVISRDEYLGSDD